VTLKTNRQGVVTDSAAVTAEPFFEQLADVKAGLAEANAEVAELEAQEHPGTGEEMHGTEHPADGTVSPPVSNGGGVQPAPPRVPPRRTPPGAADA